LYLDGSRRDFLVLMRLRLLIFKKKVKWLYINFFKSKFVFL